MTAGLEELHAEAGRLVELFTHARLRIVTAESCTGGMVSALLTDIPGSSAVLERGFVTYSNEAKRELLGVEPAALARCGAVSEPVALQMAEGALRASHAEVSVAVTGIAGPGGGSAEKPVGLVHFACAHDGAIVHRVERFGDLGRDEVRRASVRVAFAMLKEFVEKVRPVIPPRAA